MRCVLSWCVHYFFVTAYQFLEASPPHPVSSPPWRECRIRRTYSNCFNCFLILSVTDSHAGVFFRGQICFETKPVRQLRHHYSIYCGRSHGLGEFSTSSRDSLTDRLRGFGSGLKVYGWHPSLVKGTQRLTRPTEGGGWTLVVSYCTYMIFCLVQISIAQDACCPTMNVCLFLQHTDLLATPLGILSFAIGLE